MKVSNSNQRAKLWVELAIVKEKLDNEIIPVSGHLGVENPDLIMAMEELSAKIQSHFEKFRLVAIANKIDRS